MQTKDNNKPSNPHYGHRRRLREKAERNLDFLHEHEVMELVLSYIFPRGDRNLLAHDLISKYTTVYNVLCATPKELARFRGIGLQAATKLAQILPLHKRIQTTNARPKVFMNNPAQMKEYLRVLFSGLADEHLFAFYLDSKYRLIAQETIAIGGKTSATVSLARIMQFAFKHSAFGVVLAHNHPNTTAASTPADDKLTKDALFSLNACDIQLLEHCIIGEHDEYSYHADGYISALLQQAGDRDKFD